MRVLFFSGLAFAACGLVQCKSRQYNQSDLSNSNNAVSIEKDASGTYTVKCKDNTIQYSVPKARIDVGDYCGQKSQTQAPASCPANYSRVPGNPTPGLGGVENKNGVAPFCIAKFEMKHPTDASGQDRDKRDNNAVPVSQPQNRPWSKINRDEARGACERVRIPGFTVALISNGEWQTVARDIESTAANWSGGKVGAGVIPLGHGKQGPQQSLPVTNENDPFDGTGSSASSNGLHKRTHQLSTGDVVWDLAGNAEEWVYEDSHQLGVDKDNLPQQDLTDLRVLSKRNRDLFGPTGNFSAFENMGVIHYASPLYAPPSGVARGGHWFGSAAGIFSAIVATPQELAIDLSSFRCVARPIR